MSRMKPYTILDNAAHSGRSHADTVSMLKHYGFVCVNNGSGGSHRVFKHREYLQIPPFTLPTHGHGDIEAGAARAAANICMQVKALNATRRAGQGACEALPAWLDKAFGPEFARSVSADQVMQVQHGLNGSPARGYVISSGAGVLHLQSIEFAEDADFGFDFRFQGERKPLQAFGMKFAELDAVVAALIAEDAAPPRAQVTQVTAHEKHSKPRVRGV